MAERQALHAYLSEQAHEAWNKFAEENGVSVTGLLEALGVVLSDEIDAAKDSADADDIDTALGELSTNRKDWVKQGRKIDAQRRRRGGDRYVGGNVRSA